MCIIFYNKVICKFIHSLQTAVVVAVQTLQGHLAVHRKQMAAQAHYKQTLERKCFTAWQLYLTQTQQLSIIEETRKLTKNKIASFLDAAATGKLWSGRSDGNDLQRSRSFGDINQSSDSTRKRVVSFIPVESV